MLIELWGVLVNCFGYRRHIFLSGWADAAAGCAGIGSDSQATGTHRQATGTNWSTTGTDCSPIGILREIFAWANANASTSGKTVSRLQ